jgi:hypothetical protein
MLLDYYRWLTGKDRAPHEEGTIKVAPSREELGHGPTLATFFSTICKL